MANRKWYHGNILMCSNWLSCHLRPFPLCLHSIHLCVFISKGISSLLCSHLISPLKHLLLPQRSICRRKEVMEGLQRSDMSFRRQGSSGLVWDDKLLTREMNRLNEKEQEAGDDKGKPINLERSQSKGDGRGYRTTQVAPAVEPPSPRVSACGFCGAFKKSTAGNKNRRATKQGKKASR